MYDHVLGREKKARPCGHMPLNPAKAGRDEFEASLVHILSEFQACQESVETLYRINKKEREKHVREHIARDEETCKKAT